jgi:hypothetical protein
MSVMTRISVLIGAGLLAGATLGAGTAQASQRPAHDQDVVGYFSSQYDCQWVARLGEQMNRWHSGSCDQVGNQFRGLWRLEVDRAANDTGGPWHGPAGPRPGGTQPGGPRPGGPVHGPVTVQGHGH